MSDSGSSWTDDITTDMGLTDAGGILDTSGDTSSDPLSWVASDITTASNDAVASSDTSSWSEADWAKLASSLGQTIAATKQAWSSPAHPTGATPYPYSAPVPAVTDPHSLPTTSGASGAPSASGTPPATFMQNLSNFHTPYPYIAIGGGLVVTAVVVNLLRRR